ncbi:ABC-type sugar transport system, substrate-binding protein, contains N-terminal xre family HTH domain [Sporobacter termitidis DSM 10068]|uniref:ABC-type sugar transport system, substrate-binding protein, contains N-terminal xre family HTH domain n=1 Tax=Sporobacter termitidis DSM 10068 TaxID=1123282 RepID=A0A1M5UCT2_9FIRM|nr:substrate-binding domain-containing protein [Sporobacter termitidis]SHH60750.1 ABC-type sugar transport system, substrate-binding protein, contains N-terminal xre family HTH domain [Sporobacter termitidis DSM 10068]
MKKAAAILLALILALSLFACSSSSPQTTPSASTSPSSSPSAEASASPTAPTQGTVGYFDDAKTSAANRKTYKIGYFYLSTLALETAHFDAMKTMQTVLNFTCKDYSANNDDDTFVQNLEVASQEGYDGYVIEPDAVIFPRIVEIMAELKTPYVFTVNAYRDENGSNQVPTVILDQYKNGNTQVQWFFDNYKTYWKDANPADIALLTLEYSTNPDLIERMDGVKDKFKELFPGNEIIIGDLAGLTLNEQNAFDKASGILSGNPDVKYWFIDGSVENFGQGATRATETLDMTDKTMILTSGANILPKEWDAGYTGNWVASYAVYNYNYIVPALSGLIALIDGRATPETLWQENKQPGDKASTFFAGDQMVTVDTYKTVQDDIAKTYGVTSA